MIRKVACAISGGVDSAVAALLLKQRGFEVSGFYMKNWDQRDEHGTCLSGEADMEDARRTCDQLKIPFETVSFVKEYWNDVFTTFLEDFENGMTPNPDVFCNQFVKFGAFFDFAVKQRGFDAIATGHYARNSWGNFLENYGQGTAHLLKGIDGSKDQTLFLSQISQQALRRTMFPVGDLFKETTRRIARTHNLYSVWNKRDSTGICFVGKREFKDFIAEYLRGKSGQFVDVETGTVLGPHEGVHQYTVGQGCKIASKLQKHFVLHRDPKTQNIYTVPGAFHPLLYTNFILAEKPHWISEEPLLSKETPFVCLFRFQHGGGCVPCEVFEKSDMGIIIHIHFPLRAITPGQTAVFYSGDKCLGGAKILHAEYKCVKTAAEDVELSMPLEASQTSR